MVFSYPEKKIFEPAAETQTEFAFFFLVSVRSGNIRNFNMIIHGYQ